MAFWARDDSRNARLPNASEDRVPDARPRPPGDQPLASDRLGNAAAASLRVPLRGLAHYEPSPVDVARTPCGSCMTTVTCVQCGEVTPYWLPNPAMSTCRFGSLTICEHALRRGAERLKAKEIRNDLRDAMRAAGR